MRPKGNLSRRANFLLVTLILTVSVITATAYTLWRLRVEAIDRHAVAASTYAHAFEDHLTQTFNVVELTLVNALSSKGDEARMAYTLAAAVRRAPYLRSISLVGAQGTILASSESRNVGVRIVRGDFLPVTAEPRAILRTGPPWAGRDFYEGRAATPDQPVEPQTQSLIPVLLDVAIGNGTWATLLASVNTDYFLNHYESSLVPNAGVVELLRYDGILMASSDMERKSGIRNNGDMLSSRIATEEVGHFEQQLQDGHTVLTAYRASVTYPFVIVVHLDKNSGLAGWRREAAHTLAVVSIALLMALALASLYFVRAERDFHQHEAALKQIRLRGAALDAAANSIIITNRDGVIEWANPAFCALSGYAMDEVLGHTPGELVKSGVQALETYQVLWKTILAGEVWQGELINRRKDNSHYLEGQTITPMRDEDGAIRHFISVKRDITERRQNENALRESEAKMQATLDAIPDLLFEFGLDGRYHDYHSPQVELLAAPPQELLGHFVTEMLPPDAAAVVMEALQEANITGRSTGKQIALPLPQGETWFELSVARKSLFPDGDRRFIMLSRDITKRKSAEAALKEQMRFAQALNEIAAAISAQDVSGAILEQAVGIVGKTLEVDRALIYEISFAKRQAIGLCEWVNPLHPDIEPTRATYPLDVFVDGATEMRRTRHWLVSQADNINPHFLQDGSGEILHRQMMIQSLLWYPFDFRDDAYHLLVLNQVHSKRSWTKDEFDFLAAASQQVSIALTKVHMMDALRQSEKRMEELSRHLVVVQESARRRLSGELHDRTSPNLAAIGVNLDIMADTMLEAQSPMLSDRLEDVRALIEDTTASIREICSDLRPPVLDYAGLAAALESYVKQFQRRTGIAVSIDCAHPVVRLPPELESMLFRIVQEALTNCAKHSRAKSILVTLKLDGAPVTLSVSDDGIGFDPDSLGKTTHTSGLGMLTMREMAEFSGGRFILESAPGKGTRVTVEILSLEGQT